MKRNLLATLVFSQGVRMILGGDEMGRSQQGNNNAYCQDNEISWVRWDLSPAEKEPAGVHPSAAGDLPFQPRAEAPALLLDDPSRRARLRRT